ncbi:hypothetical protein MB14_06835 [Roseivirga ehrenbergii]|uniref:Uncharacterized protein n=1 Tax=Roseivirga ehrenbergii (strain DSM 102268 / JCM 13514 / KCTC 12282 / NCIMB 14502 / KMM 6017) TaxID=279360 RepID=A0A150X8B8_ROSEK|nr:hypothetical protein MB14_06835 [Roseivirga ehrenbergii]
MILVYFGNNAEKKIGKMKSPVKSDSFPVSTFEYSYLRTKSFSRRIASPKRNKGDLKISIREFALMQSITSNDPAKKRKAFEAITCPPKPKFTKCTNLSESLTWPMFS